MARRPRRRGRPGRSPSTTSRRPSGRHGRRNTGSRSSWSIRGWVPSARSRRRSSLPRPRRASERRRRFSANSRRDPRRARVLRRGNRGLRAGNVISGSPSPRADATRADYGAGMHVRRWIRLATVAWLARRPGGLLGTAGTGAASRTRTRSSRRRPRQRRLPSAASHAQIDLAGQNIDAAALDQIRFLIAAASTSRGATSRTSNCG